MVQIIDPENNITDEQVVAIVVDTQNTTDESDKLANSDMDDALDDLVIDEREDLDVNLNILDTSSASDDTEIADDMNVDINVEDQDIGSSQ